jgi:hypothetical protein
MRSERAAVKHSELDSFPIGEDALGRPRTKEPKEGEMVSLSIRIEGAMAKSLDEIAEKMSAERPGLAITRTDVVRVALNEWLAGRSTKHRK